MDVDSGFGDRFAGGFDGQSTVSLMVGSKVGLIVGSMVGSTWLCWAINLSKALDSSDERLNKLIILQTCFTGLVKRTHRFTGFNDFVKQTHHFTGF
jgi:hypothetical protein